MWKTHNLKDDFLLQNVIQEIRTYEIPQTHSTTATYLPATNRRIAG